MAEVRIRARAWRDLLEISAYTEANWGADQADAYIAEIEHRWTVLGQFPLAGVARPDLGAGIRSLRTAQHQIYYLVSGGDVFIARILHAAMDPGAHLGDDA